MATTAVTITDVPISGLSAANDSPTRVGNVTHLTATLSAGTNVTYAWNFGDGVLGSGATTSHIYPAVGTYTATVTATNSAGSVVATTAVTITDVPISGLSAANDSPTRVGSVTHLTATLSAGTNVTYAWNFGDGVLGSGATTSHIYPARGHLHGDGHGDEQRGQCSGDDGGHHHRCADQRLERGQRQPDAAGQRDAPHGDAERGHERGVCLELWRRRAGQRRDDLAHLSGGGHLHGDGHGDEQRGQCRGDDGGHHHRCADQRLERGQRQPDAAGQCDASARRR